MLPAAFFSWAIEEAPGFAVTLEDGFGGAAGAGVKTDAFALADGFDGDDVPEIFGDYVGYEEIDFGGRVDASVGAGGFYAVAGFGVTGGGFDLDAEESVVEVDYGVVAVAVSPRD
jgi:hypothetical protein